LSRECQFSHDGVTFNYTLVREVRKTLAVTVFPNRAVMVRAPEDACGDRIQDFLRRKVRRVLKQRRYFAQFKTPREKRYVSGETFRYRGRSYKLMLRSCDDRGERVSLQHGTLNVYSPSPKDRGHVAVLLSTWYAGRAKAVFSERLSACFKLFDYDERPTLAVRRLRKRWGSYSRERHKIILNRDLILSASRHIDYVIVHELCHIAHERHGRAFRELLESKLPEWEKLKAELELGLLGAR